MSAYFNKVTLIGRVGKKPVISQRNSDQKMAKFSVATTETWKDKETHERKEKTDWHRIVVYSSKLAEVVENYVDEGALIFIEGKIQYGKWTDPNGVERNLTDIVVDLTGTIRMLENKKNNNSSEGSENYSSKSNPDSDLGDDIPF